MLKKLLKFLNHERAQIVAVGICLVLVIWGTSCESKVTSLVMPGIKVTRTELQSEVDSFLVRAAQRFKNLDLQDSFKALVFDKVLLFTQTGTFNPAGIVQAVITILGIGAIADNVGKRRDLKKLNNVS